MRQYSLIYKNTFWLYLQTIAQLVFPLITLPYLIRVLSMNAYGVVAYVTSVLVYLRLLVDFGYSLSSTREISLAKGNKEEISKILGTAILGKTFLSIAGLVLITGMTLCIPILHQYQLYTMLSYIPVALSIILVDFLFRGIEKMHILSIRYVIMKSISTILTFFVIHNDNDLLWIPILDIIGTSAACLLTFIEIKKLGIHFVFCGLNNVIGDLKISFTYFISNMATTAFGALNTLLIGLMLPINEVALWSLSLTLVGAAQSLYSPIMTGIYPYMCKHKDKGLLQKLMLTFMPLILIAAGLTYLLSPWVFTIFGGAKYVEAVPVFRMLLPMLVISFPAMLFGWPALGALGKAAETSRTTILAAVVQILGLGLLIFFQHFTLLAIAAMRGISELSLFIGRYLYYRKFADEYKN